MDTSSVFSRDVRKVGLAKPKPRYQGSSEPVGLVKPKPRPPGSSETVGLAKPKPRYQGSSEPVGLIKPKPRPPGSSEFQGQPLGLSRNSFETQRAPITPTGLATATPRQAKRQTPPELAGLGINRTINPQANTTRYDTPQGYAEFQGQPVGLINPTKGNFSGQRTDAEARQALVTNLGLQDASQLKRDAFGNISNVADAYNQMAKGRLTEDQYGPSTSGFAKNISSALAPAGRKLDSAMGIGESLKLAPDQIDHLIRGYFGAVGVTAVTLLDAAERAVKRGTGQPVPEAPEMRMDRFPVIRAFYRADPDLRSRYVTEFYDLYREVDQTHKSISFRMKEGLVDEAQSLLDEQRNTLAARPIMQQGIKTMRDLRLTSRQIRRDTSMSPAEKRQRLEELAVIRNQIAKQSVQAARGLQ